MYQKIVLPYSNLFAESRGKISYNSTMIFCNPIIHQLDEPDASDDILSFVSAAAQEYNLDKLSFQFPKHCLAGNRKDEAKMSRKGIAMDMRYANLNEGGIRYLIVDYDKHYFSLIVELATGAPRPNFIVADRESGRCQLFYRLQFSVHPDNHKATHLASRVHKGITRFWGGDVCFNNGYTKNPLSEHWQTFHITECDYDLKDFMRFIVEPKKQAFSLGKNDAEMAGRNCSNYYQSRRECGAVGQELAALESGEALDKIWAIYQGYNQQHKLPLAHNEAMASCRSIWKSIKRGYRGDVRRKVMQFDKGVSPVEKMAAGGVYGGKKCRANKNRAISEAWDYLVSKGMQTSIRQLAKQARCSPVTVQRWKRELVEQIKLADKIEIVEPVAKGTCPLSVCDVSMIDNVADNQSPGNDYFDSPQVYQIRWVTGYRAISIKYSLSVAHWQESTMKPPVPDKKIKASRPCLHSDYDSFDSPQELTERAIPPIVSTGLLASSARQRWLKSHSKTNSFLSVIERPKNVNAI